jgi:hypothetical protein
LSISIFHFLSWVESDSTEAYWVSTASSAKGDRFAAVSTNSFENDRGFVYTFYEGVWTQRTTIPSQYNGISSSGDGRILMTCISGGGNVQLSTDYGETWTTVANSSPQNWVKVVLAEDGLTGLAVAYGGQLWKYTSAGGLLSIKLNLSLSGHTWVDVAMSDDGTVVAAATLDRVYVSTNSGTSFFRYTPPSGLSNVNINNPWKAVAVRGQLVLAVPTEGKILQRTMNGGGWSNLPGSPNDRWQNVTFVGGGVKATAISGATYTYLDLGSSVWDGPVYYFDLNNRNVDMAASVNGTNAIASVYGGGVYLSTNGGHNLCKFVSPPRVTRYIPGSAPLGFDEKFSGPAQKERLVQSGMAPS